MTRIEAFKALFGLDSNSTASQEAIGVLGNNPELTDDENDALSSNTEDVDVLDKATDFAAKPESYANQLDPGPAKDLLLTYAGRLKAKAFASTATSPDTSAGSTTATKSEVMDPLADLGVGASSPSADSDVGDIRPSRPGKPKASTIAPDATPDNGRGKGKDRRDRRTDADAGGTSHSEPAVPPPPPKRPGSTVPLEWHEARKLSQWPPLRDQLIAAALDTRSADNAVRHPAVTRLQKLRGVIELYYGQGPQLRIMAIMARMCVEDLRNQLDLTDPPEFRARYDVF